MLAIDYFPLRRYEQLGWGRLLREKAVLIGLGVVAAAAAMITESQKGGFMIPLEKIALSQRVLLMFQSLVFYPWKLVWPVRLSPYYPLRESLSLDHVWVLLSMLCVGVITVLAARERRRLPALAAGWGAYVVQMLPVSGLTQRGLVAVALRYAYMAILPLLLVVGGAVVWAWRRSTTAARVALIGLLGCELCVFGVRTRSLIPDWHDDIAYWRAVVAQLPESEANWGLAATLLERGRAPEALEYAQRAVEITPQLYMAHNTLGRVLARLGRLQDAVKQFQQALRLKPDDCETHVNWGNALQDSGNVQEAIAQYELAVRLKPDSAEVHISLGNALLTQGNARDAVANYEEALRLKPDNAEAHDNLGIALAQARRLPEAMEHWEQALKLKPDDVEAHVNLGKALEGQGRLPEAIAHYQQALKLRPDFLPAKNALTRLGAGQ